MTDWVDLERELEAWGRAGQNATLWWRDDDAITATPTLRHLLDLAAAGQPVPLALAVIPMAADATLAQSLENADHVVALQHGYAHANHAAEASKKAEFPVGRESSTALQDLQRGSQRLRELFGDRALPVLVPPWNRIDEALLPSLAGLGFTTLSLFGPAEPRPIKCLNTHVDLLAWRGERKGKEHTALVAEIVAQLTARLDSGSREPIGLLSHHLVHDETAWSFLQGLFETMAEPPACRWLSARDLM